MELPPPETLRRVIDGALADRPAASWRNAIAQVADQLLGAQRPPDASPEDGS
jgi:hypothetical protein